MYYYYCQTLDNHSIYESNHSLLFSSSSSWYIHPIISHFLIEIFSVTTMNTDISVYVFITTVRTKKAFHYTF